MRPDDLPEFSDPPVVEVVLGMQFQPVRQLRQAHFGLFWQRIQEDYPKTVDHGRLETVVEALDGSGQPPTFQIEMLDSPPTHRTWFVSADDERLIQLQDDRLVHNWRHRSGPYPRFEVLREQFWSAFKSLSASLASAGLQTPQPRQVEVTYINWIATTSPLAFLKPASASRLDVDGVGPEPSFQNWLARYDVRDSDDHPVGRLTIESKPGARPTDHGVQPGYLLSLTYLGPTEPESSETDVDLQFLHGRDTIVRAFASVTDEAMHTDEHWGRLR